MNITATLFAQMLTFAVLVWAISRFMWGPLVRLMEERNRRIADGLATAERGKHEFELAQRRAVGALRDSKARAGEILMQAEHRANQIIEEAKVNAHTEAERVLAGAAAEVERETFRLKEALRQRVADLAIAGAEKILRREIDEKAHAELLTSIKSEL